MPVNKVVFGDRTLIDLTSDTVSADKLAKGVTAHDKTGVQITGTMESGGSSEKYGATVDTFLGDVDASGVLQAPTGQADLVFDGVTDLAMNALYYRFYENHTISSVSFPQLVQITGKNALYNCFYNAPIENISFPVLQSVTGESGLSNVCSSVSASIQSVSFPALTTVSGTTSFSGAFSNCGEITSASFPVLEEITGNVAFYACFASCSALTNVSFPKLKKIGSDTTTGANYRHFDGSFRSTGITSLEFPELTAIYCSSSGSYGGTFSGNSTIQKMYFPKLTVIDKSPAYTGNSTAQNYIFSGCNSLTELHFGAANQAAIEALPGYATLWGRGAGKATVYFDPCKGVYADKNDLYVESRRGVRLEKWQHIHVRCFVARGRDP